MTPPAYFKYWGKARPGLGAQAACHLLPYHSLDVAATGVGYLRRSPSVRALFEGTLGLAGSELEAWLAFWLALHDLGKYSEAFQGQCPDVFERLNGRAHRKTYTTRHDSLGMLYWRDVLQDRLANEDWFGDATEGLMDGLDWWVRSVTGHHGQPPLEGHDAVGIHFDTQADGQAIRQFLEVAREMFLSRIPAGASAFKDARRFNQQSRVLSWWVAGIAVLADWIGSNTSYFEYRDKPQDLKTYWAHAQFQADEALRHAGVLPAGRQDPLSFQELFPQIKAPSPLQNWAEQVVLTDGPQIHLLEDVTGAGKTEAAMTLAHRLMASGCADGFFIGLPTMATANAMYGRMASFYQRMFACGASLALAHGQRELVDVFAASVLQPGEDEQDQRQGDDTATARCAAWLADHNKRALLAPAGVGTIDQALLSVLHSKHQSVRLLGLFRKVIIVDEVHACDAYMQGVLEELLIFHGRSGGSVILLSATLPQRMKQALFDAFAQGCEQASPPLAEPAYPLVTSWCDDQPNKAAQFPVDTRPDVQRKLATRYVSSEDEVVEQISMALQAGRCVCWMRNTVADALNAHARFSLILAPEKLLLFHARFALKDRLETEQKVLHYFGKDSTPALRSGRLVIATQVAEQSLDADWDVVVSDLAPIDRLIQRAGRLQRHPRDPLGARLIDPSATDQRGQPCLWVLGPAWTPDPDAAWFKNAFPKSAKVYGHHGQLWLTARCLQEGQIQMPADARDLIEGVFGDDVKFPVGLQVSANQAEGEDLSEASLAQQNTVKLASGYKRGVIDWWSEAKTPSRMGEPSVNLLLARWVGGRLLPWVAHADPRHAWAYSTLRVPERLISETAVPSADAQQLELARVLEALPDKGKWSVLLPLTQTDLGWTGEALAQFGTRQVKRQWTYDPLFGLKETGGPNA